MATIVCYLSLAAPAQVTQAPTANPTYAPTYAPTATASPTRAPTASPTSNPTRAPTMVPTTQPTAAPTNVPTYASPSAPPSPPSEPPPSAPPSAPPSPPSEPPPFAPGLDCWDTCYTTETASFGGQWDVNKCGWWNCAGCRECGGTIDPPGGVVDKHVQDWATDRGWPSNGQRTTWEGEPGGDQGRWSPSPPPPALPPSEPPSPPPPALPPSEPPPPPFSPGIDGTLRLVGGTTAAEGRVEIYYNGEWGTVCDHPPIDQTSKGAEVICRELGLQGGEVKTMAYFGEGSGKTWLDNVNCAGSEARLQDCTHGGWGVENCFHIEDVGVVCTSATPAPTAPATPAPTAPATPAPTSTPTAPATPAPTSTPTAPATPAPTAPATPAPTAAPAPSTPAPTAPAPATPAPTSDAAEKKAVRLNTVNQTRAQETKTLGRKSPHTLMA